MKGHYAKILRITAIALLLITGVNAAVAGLLFIADPSGARMGMNVLYIKDSPFDTYLIPGIVLLVFNGVLNFVATYYALRKTKFSPLLILLQGIVLIAWIVIQVIMVNDIAALHVIMFFIGVALALAGMALRKM